MPECYLQSIQIMQIVKMIESVVVLFTQETLRRFV